ncbi:ABC transporter permease subunit [Chromobacterium violaceum]|uniref:ABC transporter permease subunit n=1 Tax=Chromobacterium violaceum TaxID=536 RepID=UPI00211501F2|nr:ABC transporter permease subunit [Chromobacterium violaceum]
MTTAVRHFMPATARRLIPNRWDLIAFPLILGFLLMATTGIRETWAPITALQTAPISLEPGNLPEYALRTTLRMLAAMAASLAFTLVYGTLAAKSRRAGLLLVPILDILQSVPVLGYISFTVTFFLALFPGRVLGAEFAAIFAIFTSQAWNMTFSFYQSLRTVPRDLQEVSVNLRLTAWQKFWKLEVPYAMPGMIWNMMMSMSGGWFFVVASEAITVGDKTVMLPGVGSYLALAIQHKDLAAVGWVILTMSVVILIYDQFLFRPLVAWADKFRLEDTASQNAPESWVLNLIQRTRFIQQLLKPFGKLLKTAARLRLNISLPKGLHSEAHTPGVARHRRAVVGAGGTDRRRRRQQAGSLHRHRSGRLGSAEGVRPGPGHAGACQPADRHRLADLGAAGRADRPASGAGREGPAAGAVSGRFPGQPVVPCVRDRHRPLQAEP